VTTALPVIDLAALRADHNSRAIDELRQAGEEWGFYYVVNHGVGSVAIARALRAAKRFFALPMTSKERISVDARHRGYLGFGSSQMDDAEFVDLKESFVYGVEHVVPVDDGPRAQLVGPNQWTPDVPEMEPAITAFFDAMITTGRELLEGIAVALGLSPAFFVSRLEDPLARGSVIHYPAATARADTEQLGVGPHTDYGLLTLLWQDEVGGLQVQTPDGEWLDVPPAQGSLLVNTGDLLARWTNDQLRSNRHRVVSSGHSDRYSMAVFVDPSYDVVVDPREGDVRTKEPPRYEPVVTGEHVAKRFASSFSYRRDGP
jgi:isopenicillin N synthase-like dioxygenase